ncbi:MAG TPA: class I tRNA ligase family protein, partial [Roseiflexaceae bacterium]|nr:class I tRNA ligase family protein [Roseiflexaceae bacterium]
FFWTTLCDNYLEWAKARLYDGDSYEQEAARTTLAIALAATLKLFAPFLPHVTEAIYQAVFRAGSEQFESLHTSMWPDLPAAADDAAEQAGAAFVAIGAAVRRFKSERRLGLGTPLHHLGLAVDNTELHTALARSEMDLRSLTRAATIDITQCGDLEDGAEHLADGLAITITP